MYGMCVATQVARRAATRARLLDATLDCLVERGFAATTVAEIQDRAGVARGTLLHHFPTKVELLVAAVSHVAQRRAERFALEVDLITKRADRLSALVDALWRDLNSPAFFAALELWVAARTDPELRDALVPVERELFALIHAGTAAIVGDRSADPRTATLIEFTIDTLTGLSLSTILTGNAGSREALIRRWKRALAVLFGELDAGELIEGLPAAQRLRA
jgi:AcrR family transcriptional regulator